MRSGIAPQRPNRSCQGIRRQPRICIVLVGLEYSNKRRNGMLSSRTDICQSFHGSHLCISVGVPESFDERRYSGLTNAGESATGGIANVHVLVRQSISKGSPNLFRLSAHTAKGSDGMRANNRVLVFSSHCQSEDRIPGRGTYTISRCCRIAHTPRIAIERRNRASTSCVRPLPLSRYMFGFASGALSVCFPRRTS